MQTLHSVLISKAEALGGEDKKMGGKESIQNIYKQKSWTENKQSSDMIYDHIVITQ